MTRRHALPKESQHALDRLRPARALRAVGSARQFTARVPSAGRHEDPRQRERAGVEHRLAERPAVAPPPAHLRSHWVYYEPGDRMIISPEGTKRPYRPKRARSCFSAT